MMEQTNPVKRLYKLLTAVTSTGHEPILLSAEAWTTALGVANRTDLMRALPEVLNLLDSCEHAIRQNSQLDTERYLGLLNSIRDPLVTRGFFGSTNDLRNAVSRDALARLEFAADAVQMSENIPPDDEIVTLIDQVNTLLDEIAGSELDEELAVYLVNGAKAIHSALVHYDVFGHNGLRSAFFSQIGMIYVLQDDIQRHPIRVKCINLVKALFGVLSSSDARNTLRMLSAVDQSLSGLALEPGDDAGA